MREIKDVGSAGSWSKVELAYNRVRKSVSYMSNKQAVYKYMLYNFEDKVTYHGSFESCLYWCVLVLSYLLSYIICDTREVSELYQMLSITTKQMQTKLHRTRILFCGVLWMTHILHLRYVSDHQHMLLVMAASWRRIRPITRFWFEWYGIVLSSVLLKTSH